MNIGTLAKQTGLAQSRIRFYEAQGLLGAVRRTPNGYRVYAPEAGHILGIITSAQDAGFTLDEIRNLLPQSEGALWDRVRLAASLKAKLADIAIIQARLVGTRGNLEALLARIERDDPNDTCFTSK